MIKTNISEKEMPKKSQRETPVETGESAVKYPTISKQKTVKIKLYKDNESYKDDVFVAVNGESFLIKRGVEVDVPLAVSEVLAGADIQNQKATALVDSLKSNSL